MKASLLATIRVVGCAEPIPVPPPPPVVKVKDGLAFHIEKGPGDERVLVVSTAPGTKGPIALAHVWIRTIGTETEWSQFGEETGRIACAKVAITGYSGVRTIHRSRPLRERFVKRPGSFTIDGVNNLREPVAQAFGRRGVPIWTGRVPFAQSEVP